MSNLPKIRVIGGGLAGCDAAWQALSAGFQVEMSEMRPKVSTAAHKTGNLAELVCSNSLKSLQPDSAPGLLKDGMRHFGSLILEAADTARVPAGQALAVDREKFSAYISEHLEGHPNFTRSNEEVTELPSEEELAAQNEAWIIATGPLTTAGLAQSLQSLCKSDERLYFYDAIAPIIAADSIDMNIAFRQSRYDKEESGAGDYINLPMDKEQYEAFVDAALSAEYMPLHAFEDTKYFESCLPVEVMMERGRETLRFGPLKPVGLTDPHTGRRPWAVVQLRQENVGGTMYSMVGFQTKMKWPEQKRVFSMIPGLAEAEFFRYGSVHRNTYLQSPKVLNKDFSFKNNKRIFLAGQITGVEGYTESAAIGILAGRSAVARLQDKIFIQPPKTSMIGALAHYVTEGGLGNFAPMNANMGLLPGIQKQRGVSKQERKARQCALSRQDFEAYAAQQ
jgi:methylenetetrahydrofolate--tRNA-(uracil-5-)-methyltransferase